MGIKSIQCAFNCMPTVELVGFYKVFICIVELAYNIEEMTVDDEENVLQSINEESQPNENGEFVEEQDDSDLTFSQHTGNKYQ